MNFDQKFREEFARLNPAQRQAVETIEGPLLVVAGPGTGKTQTISLRLANILKKTQARPHNLLALTFTESGAIALKKRLASVIGADAFGITATTFHSFCANLAATFPAEFGAARERLQLDELGKFKLLREILFSGEFEFLRPLRAREMYLRAIGTQISTLKREGISPARFEILVSEEAENFAAIPDSEKINPRTGKPKIKFQKTGKAIAKWRELSEIYATYEKKLRELAAADFDELILSVAEKLENPDDQFLLAYLQENFLYATVDEFQDTNGAQNRLLAAWGSFDDKPNLCAVGDDDQSIYRFQGASLANILEFREKYPAATIVTLTENYRSTQPILDSAGNLIAKNSERLVGVIDELEKNLTANLDGGSRPRVAEFESEEDEATWLVEEIQKLLAAKIEPSEIAVIYRNRRDGDLPADFLRRAGVPIFRHDGVNALANRRVRQLVEILKTVENPADGESQLAVFFADFTGIPAADVYRLSRAADRKSNFLDLLAEEKLFERLAENDPPIHFSDEKKLLEWRDRLLGWQQKLTEISLVELVEHAAAESGLAATVAAEKDYEAAESLAAFVTFVRNFEISQPVDADTPTKLAALLADLATMRDQNISISLPTRPTEAVQLMTAHRSKGLEFEHVFVVRAVDEIWGGKKRGEILTLPEIVADSSHAEKESRVEDERRLFFVAMTRAKKSLAISHAKNYGFREFNPSRFLAEVGEKIEKIEPKISPDLKLSLVLPTATQKKASDGAGLAGPATSENDAAAEADGGVREGVSSSRSEAISLVIPTTTEFALDTDSKKFLESLVERYRLSPTGLNRYLACPRAFLFYELLRLPTARKPDEIAGAIFGTAIHAAFEKYFSEFKKTDALPDRQLALAELKISLDRQPLTKNLRENILRDATKAVENWLDFWGESLRPPLEVEFNFRRHDVWLDGIPLTGTIDRVDLLPDSKNEVAFTDYKSMRPLTPAAIRGETANSTGDAYRQLLFYSVLADADPRFIWQPKILTIDFLRPTDDGEFKKESFTPTAEEITEIKKTIHEVYEKIRSLEFGCGEDELGCHRCGLQNLCEKK